MDKIEETIDADGVSHWSYRGWELRQDSCDHPECNCGKPVWVTAPPYEMDKASFDRISTRAGFSVNTSNMVLSRLVDGTDTVLLATIESAIDAWEGGLAQLRQEAWVTGK